MATIPKVSNITSFFLIQWNFDINVTQIPNVFMQDLHVKLDYFVNIRIPRNAAIDALKVRLIEQEQEMDSKDCSIDDLTKEVDDLKNKVAILEKKTPKAELITENEGLKRKNADLKKTIGTNKIEAARLKNVEVRYKNLLKKHGTSGQILGDLNTREEILKGMDDQIVDFYHYFANKNFTEIETKLFLMLCYLDLSGKSRFELISKLLRFTSHGIQSCIVESLEKSLAEKKKELKSLSKVVVDDENEFEMQAAGNSTPKESGISGIESLESKMKGPTKTRPTVFDSSFDGFGKMKFYNDDNQSCKFVRTSSFTYIAASANPASLFTHKLVRTIPCAIPTCDVLFKQGITVIGRAVVCAPENHEKYGHTLMLCKMHIEKSIHGIADSEFEEAAANAENTSLVEIPRTRPPVIRALFNDVEENLGRTNTPADLVEEDVSGKQLAADVNEVICTEPNDVGENLVRTNTLADLVEKDNSGTQLATDVNEVIHKEPNDGEQNEIPNENVDTIDSTLNVVTEN